MYACNFPSDTAQIRPWRPGLAGAHVEGPAGAAPVLRAPPGRVLLRLGDRAGGAPVGDGHTQDLHLADLGAVHRSGGSVRAVELSLL